MANKIQKKDEPTQLSANFNILIENELNAIGKLPPDLANRAMDLLQESTHHRMQCDDKIIALEEKNLDLQELDTRKYYNYSLFGIIFFFLVSIIGIIGGVFLAYYDKSTESYIAFAIAFINLTPKLIKTLRK